MIGCLNNRINLGDILALRGDNYVVRLDDKLGTIRLMAALWASQRNVKACVGNHTENPENPTRLHSLCACEETTHTTH